MLTIEKIREKLNGADAVAMLSSLYCCSASEALEQAQRYLSVLMALEREYGSHGGAALFSAPGRTEIGGNHTDHQHGCVVAGSVNIDMIAAVGENSLNQLRISSEGYEPCVIELDELTKRPWEENTSVAIARGCCRAFADRGAALRGLDIYIASNVPRGSGISSSAAFEVLMGTILNELCMETKVSPVEIAQMGQWVENEYFGKPCGLMDQMASAVGGIISIDFADSRSPFVRKVDFDLQKAELSLCIIDSGADHADLTEDYASIPSECCSAAKICGGDVLRDVEYHSFMKFIPEIREKCGDRAVLRALHFYAENLRAQEEADALESADYSRFLQLVNESCDSSWEYLQNITPAGSSRNQAVALTIALARQALGSRGAVRVHGGGFAGTVQAFVPTDILTEFQSSMEAVLGHGMCHVMSIRPVGCLRVM